MFRKLLLRIYFLIVQPSKEWRALAEEEQGFDKFLSIYFHPLLGIITLAAFVGAIIARWSVETTLNKHVEAALKSSILEFTAYFAGFYLASFLLKEIIKRKYAEANVKRASCFVAYASSPVYLISVITSLSGPGAQVVYFFLPYTVYIIWEGATIYLGVEEKKQMGFSLTSAVLVLIPYLIYFIISKLMLI
jgi:hypothetical protein